MAIQIESELRETINLMNVWQRRLRDWDVWESVLADFEGDDAWRLRDQFVDVLSHYCMLQPSSTRDRLARIATTALHHANLQTQPGYKDALATDNRKNPFMGRRDVEKQMNDIGASWSLLAPFSACLTALDSEQHRNTTSDYRNNASHFIAPRIEVGITNLISRQPVPATEYVENADGTLRQVAVPGKKMVRYGFGGTEPLRGSAMLKINAQEYGLAVEAFDAYQALLKEMIAKLPASEKAAP